jgi:hypothetical protein
MALSGVLEGVRAILFLLKQSERHYSEDRGKGTSPFPLPIPRPTVWTQSPKGALMQTSFACGRDFAPCTSTRGVPAPATLTNRTPVGYRKPFAVPSRQREAAPSPRPHPTVHRLDAGNVSPFHHDSRGCNGSRG